MNNFDRLEEYVLQALINKAIADARREWLPAYLLVCSVVFVAIWQVPGIPGASVFMFLPPMALGLVGGVWWELRQEVKESVLSTLAECNAHREPEWLACRTLLVWNGKLTLGDLKQFQVRLREFRAREIRKQRPAVAALSAEMLVES